MPPSRFVEVTRPSQALVDVSARAPGHYHVALVDALLRCSVPAAGHLGPLRCTVVRRGLLRVPMAARLRVLPRRHRPDLETVGSQLVQQWGALAGRSTRLPERLDDVSMLCLPRSLGWLLFAFGDGAHPIVVCKVPGDDDPRADEEAAVLRSLEQLPFVPTYLGTVGNGRVQSALPGLPLHFEPLRLAGASEAAWGPQLSQATAILAELGTATLSRDRTVALTSLSPEAEELVSPAVASLAAGAIERLRLARVSVIVHGDASPQNLLVSGGTVTGLVDWELARPGLPGTDVLNLVQSVFEQRLGLRRWKEEEIARAFDAAWDHAPLFTNARRAVTYSAEQSGLSVRDLEIAFFVRRLQRRVDRPDRYVVSPALAARMLERACGS